MLKNYLNIALRNLGRQKTYSLINITGLSVGLACCLLIFFYVRHEHSYDRFHEKKDQIFRMVRSGNDQPIAVTSMLLGPTLQEAYSDVENTVRLYPEAGIINVAEHRFQEDLLLVDPAFLEMFTFPLQQGDPIYALSDPNGVVLSHESAQKYFGQENPMGQRLSIRIRETFYDFIVRGVAEPVPEASSIRFNVLIPMAKLASIDPDDYNKSSWGTLRPRTYIQLAEGTGYTDFEARLPSFVETHLPPNFARHTTFAVQPLTDIHLNPEVTRGLFPTSNPLYSYILSAVAILILLIACINFTTLTLGLSTTRIREVGVRKVIGAVRIQLIKQFWGESFVVSMIALLISLILVQIMLPAFNNVVGTTLTIQMDGSLVLALAGLLMIVSLVAGSYPALFLSRLMPVSVLKGGFVVHGRKRLTQALVVAQFTLSIFLVSCMLLMSDQLNLLSQKQLGYDAEQVVRIRSVYGSTWEGNRLLESYSAALSGESSILSLTGSTYEMGELDEGKYPFPFVSETDSVPGYTINVTADFSETLGLEIVEGRDFSRDRVADSLRSVIVNESLVRAFGWEDPLGKPLSSFFFGEATVIGVVKDFNFESLHKPIEPLVLYIDRPNPIWSIYARVAAGNLPASIAVLEDAWQEVAPELPFEFTFLDQAVDQQYQAEQRWMTLIRLASGFALFIACLGLLGLASMAAVRRRKEIGIRKVLGASVRQIVLMLSQQFVKLVLMALVLASPIAYVVMNRWLETFAYRVDISWYIFVLTGLIAVSIAVLTVSYQAIKAALTNPTRSLRYE